MSLPQIEPQIHSSQTYLFREHPFFYVTLSDLAPGMGMLQIHSDWGTYSHFWGSMGDETIAQFLRTSSAGYVENKLSYQMRFMGMKKEAEQRLAKFMSQCWPRFIEFLKYKNGPPEAA